MTARRRRDRRRSRTALPRPDHWPTLEREQHAGGTVEVVREITEGGIATVRGRTARAECMLDYYRHSRTITTRQWAAGMRVREVGAVAALGACVVGSYGERLPRSQEMSDAAVRARIGLQRMFLELGDAEGDAVRSLCLFDEPAGKRLDIIRGALDTLAECFRLPADP